MRRITYQTSREGGRASRPRSVVDTEIQGNGRGLESRRFPKIISVDPCDRSPETTCERNRQGSEWSEHLEYRRTPRPMGRILRTTIVMATSWHPSGAHSLFDENLVDLEYADDILHILEEREGERVFLDELTKVIQSFSMHFTPTKCIVLLLDINTPLAIQGEALKVVEHFTYLGSCVSSDCSVTDEINARICKARVAFGSLRHPWCHNGVSLNLKGRVYQATVRNNLLKHSNFIKTAVWKLSGIQAREIYLVILGLDNAGKTTTTRSIKGSKFDPVLLPNHNNCQVSSDLVAPTVGFDRIEFSTGKFHVNLYDLGGGRTIRDIWKNYFAEVHGVIFVVDSSDTERLSECRAVLSKLLAHSSVSGKPVLFPVRLANKKDVAEALDEPELIEALKLDQLVNQFRCPCRLERCCALLTKHKKLDKAIRTGLRWLLTYIESQLPDLEKRIRLDTEKQAREQALEREARRERVRLARERRERLDIQQDSNGVLTSADGGSDRTYSVTSSKHSDHTGKMGDGRMEEHGTPSRRLTVIDLESK
ncbi:ADP-ribosylation factor-like 2-like 1, partial [Clonorchis sinensis]